MSVRKCIFRVMVAFVFLALVKPLAACKAVCLPFKTAGSPTSAITTTPGPASNQITVELTAEGHGTHVGRYITFVRFVITISPEGATFDGEITMVAANGDELYLEHFGTVTPDGGGAGGYIITGGMGRFDGATGEGLFLSVAGEAGFETTMDGSICFPRE